MGEIGKVADLSWRKQDSDVTYLQRISHIILNEGRRWIVEWTARRLLGRSIGIGSMLS